MPDKPERAEAIRRRRNANTSAVSLRPATAGELERAYRLMRDNMQPHLDLAGIPWDQQWTERNYRTKDNFSLFIREQWRGFISLELSPGTLFIHTLQLTPESQGRIFGIAVFDWLLEKAAAHGASTMGCRALRSSPVLGLYRKLGFRIIAEEGVLCDLSLELASE